MNLRDLKYLIAVSEELNFHKASKKCYVSQPALSLSVKKIEEELGVPLFERGTRKIRVTPIGETIVAKARDMLAMHKEMVSLARSRQDDMADPLRVGAILTVAPYLFPVMVPAVKKALPKLKLNLHEDVTHTLTKQIINGELDVAIVALPVSGPSLATQSLYDEEFSVVVPRKHAWAKRKRIAADDLNEQQVLLLNEGHCFSDQVLNLCAGSATADWPRSGNSLETIRNMIISGMGISVFPESAIKGDDTVRVPFKDPVPRRTIGAVWSKNSSRKTAINAFLESLEAISLPWSAK